MRRPRRALAFVAVLAAAGWALPPGRSAPAREHPAPAPVPAAQEGRVPDGPELYLTGCSSCHGPAGEGTKQGPSLRRSGAAGAYYYLATGRMPLAAADAQPRRKRPAYSPEEIDRLVEHVASFGSGPEIPEVHPERGDLAEGGVLFRSSCAPCHSAAGIGGALSYGRAAPSVHSPTAVQIAAAIRIGPGQMPVFGPEALDEEEVDSIVRYVEYLQAPATPGGLALGGAGPIPEGFVAWIFGVGTLVLAVLWIGTRQEKPGQEGHGRA